MASTVTDLNTLHNPASGTSPTATYGDAIRDNFQNIHLNVERCIASVTLGSAASSISSGTLQTVANGWRLVVLVRALITATGGSVGVRFNGDSGSNYSRQLISSIDATATAIESTGNTEFTPFTVATTTANRWTHGRIEVFDYLGSNHKSLLSHGYDPGSLTSQQMYIGGGQWASTSAITSVSVHASTSTFVTGSQLIVMATPLNP